MMTVKRLLVCETEITDDADFQWALDTFREGVSFCDSPLGGRVYRATPADLNDILSRGEAEPPFLPKLTEADE